jgi:DNA recombination protein RmuC
MGGDVMEAVTVGITGILIIIAFIIGRMSMKTSDDNLRIESVLKASESEIRREMGDLNRSSEKSIRDTVLSVVDTLGKEQHRHLSKVSDDMGKLTDSNEKSMVKLQESNEKKLDQMRMVVDEKLQETLDKRITESFKIVSERLEAVTSGLGEMKLLAQDVGGLKKVLSNVSSKGALGELQAEQILANFLDQSQYSKNVKTNPSHPGEVEFAIRLPGQSTSTGNPVWIPLDSKFPTEDHDRLKDSREHGDKKEIKSALDKLASTVRAEAKKISKLYVSPPHTTDFGIMFLPTEGLYADVVNYPGLLEELQRDRGIMICGPSNLAAFVSSMQIGFRTLALESKTSEVRDVLATFKMEFVNFDKMILTALNQVNTAAKTLGGDEGVQRRLRVMEKTLRNVETSADTKPLLLEE